MKTNRWTRAGATRVVGGAIAAAALSACTKGPPDCRADQYWSEPIRTCVGLRQWMESNDGAYPDGYVAPEASSEAGMDATAEAATPTCDGGQRACGASCSDLATDPLNCGVCGAACPTAANASATCVAGRCDLRCDTGAHRCGASCLRDDDTASCGSRCTPCPEPLGARPTCAVGMCGYECLGGYDDTGSACEMRVARPLFPWGLSTVTMLRPTLRWELPMGVEGAQVELCRDRACTTVIERVNAVGTSARPSADLPASTVVFWRLRGRIGAVNSARTSATWQFRTPARSATTADTAHGVELDVNGDGYSDVAIGAPGANGNTGRVDVYYGSAAGLGAMPAVTLRGSVMGARFGSVVASLGDVNGDGFGDLAIGGIGTGGQVLVFHGAASGGIGTTTTRSIRGTTLAPVGCVIAGLGDVNGDGYGDIASACEDASLGGVSEAGAAQIFLGASEGVNGAAALTISGSVIGEAVGRSVSGAGDINGDRLADIVIGAPGARNAVSQRIGAVRIHLGAAVAPSATPSATLSGVDDGGNFGGAVEGTADVNGDGFSDVFAAADSAAHEGRARCGTTSLFVGAATGLASVASATLSGTSPGDQLGSVVARAGDINADGFDDVVVTSLWAAPGGQVKVFHGSASGVSASARRTLNAVDALDFFGAALYGLSDVNGDGFSDFVVGSPGVTVSGRMNAGTVSLFRGTSEGAEGTSARVFEGLASEERLGTAIGAAR